MRVFQPDAVVLVSVCESPERGPEAESILDLLVDNDIADDVARYLGAPGMPDGVFHAVDDAIHILRGDGASRARDTQT